MNIVNRAWGEGLVVDIGGPPRTFVRNMVTTYIQWKQVCKGKVKGVDTSVIDWHPKDEDTDEDEDEDEDEDMAGGSQSY